jgi:hypothetical protein
VKVADENQHVRNHPLPTIKLELRKMTTDLLSSHFSSIGTIHQIFNVAVVVVDTVVMKVVGPN